MIGDLINITIKSNLNTRSALSSSEFITLNEKSYLSNINSNLINDDSGHYINLKKEKKATNSTLKGT
jgi:hypothetical protein